MKKIITLLALLLTLGIANANAQDESQMWWGYYNGTQKTSLYGTYKLDTYEVAMFVAGDGELSNVTINGARFQSRTYSNATNCKIWVRDSLNGENLAEAEFTPSTTWISATFDEPVTMPSTGVYVGYTFTLSDWYSDYDYTPIVYCSKVVKNSFWAKTKSGGETWENKSSSGALAGQILVSGGNLGINAAALDDDMEDVLTVIGKEIPVTLNLINMGTAGVNDIDFTYTLDGTTHEGHADLAAPIEAMYKAEGKCDITLTGANQTGTQEVTITVTKVNGAVNEETEDNTASFNLVVLEQGAKRKSLVETYVGTGKYYAPLAYVGMENMVDSLGEDVIPVAIHVGDAMAVSEYSDWTSTIYSYPTCNVDRTVWTHPYYGNATTAPYHFEADKVIAEANQNVAEAELNYVHGKLVDGEDGYPVTVDAKAIPHFMFDGDTSPYRVVFMLVVDSLSGEGTGWDQYNYLCYYKSNYPDDDVAYYRDECGYTITGLKYNNVVVAINNVRGEALTDEGASTATLTIPEWVPSELRNSDNMRVVAAIYNTNNSKIVNAEVGEANYEDINLRGDVNGDGEVSIADVNAVIDLILSGSYEVSADVNEDGEVTIADVNAVIDIILNAE